MRSWGGHQALTLPQQHLFLNKNPIVQGEGGITRGVLRWRVEVRPTPLSRSYVVRIEYKLGDSPDVFVEDPDIQLLAQDREIPHVYRNPLRLCLYRPGLGQWQASDRIDQTIVPWIFIWLYYFEDWLAFGDWKGGGMHPGDGTDIAPNRRERRSRRGRQVGAALG